MRWWAALLVASLLTLTSCGHDTGFADDGRVRVAAGFYPLAWVATRVGGDLVQVVSLTEPGVEPHDVEPTLARTVELAQADLVVVERGLQPGLDDAVTSNAEGTVLDVGDAVAIRPGDPHFWLDPLLLADLADAVAADLARIDPGNAAAYGAGAADLRADLTALDEEFALGLADCERHVIVTSHGAFGYWDRYGIEVAPVTGLSPDAEPSPAGIARLQQLIRDEGLTTVFSERLASPALTDSLARDLGLRTAVLDPIEGLTDDTAGEDYLSLMRENLAALKEANGCSPSS